MSKIKAIWQKLKGKKRNIGIVLMLLLRSTTAFFPDVLDEKQVDVLNEVIDWLLVGGFVDSVARSETSKQITHKSKNVALKAIKLFNQNKK